MATPNTTHYGEGRIVIGDRLAARGRNVLIADILDGLRETPKRISSMFFYDARGSQLFEEITALPEYYLTRIEKRLLKEYARVCAGQWSDVDIVELGSGDYTKISLILDSVRPERMGSIRYIPVDVSEFAIRQSAERLTRTYQGLAFHGLVADFLTQLECIPCNRPRLFCLLGSTIGNFSVAQRQAFIADLARAMMPGDEFLLGVDLVKPVEVLEKAYNDSQGVTAEFNRNILRVVNGLAETDFRPDWFAHVAYYSHEHARIEMHLRAERDMEVATPLGRNEKVYLRKNETIHTEDSHKFTIRQAMELLESVGLKVISCLQDPEQWFGLFQACKPPRGRYVGC